MEAGYTLVETIVSMAILVAALFPLVAAVMLFGMQPQVRHLQVATELAQNEIERTLRVPPGTWVSAETRDGGWVVRREVEQGPDLATVVVQVSRTTQEGNERPEPLVELATSRLVAAQSTPSQARRPPVPEN